jgi:phage terminase small subunit
VVVESPERQVSLTAKQEGFAQRVVKGERPVDAYKAEYSPKGKAAGIAVEASRLLKHPKVALRMVELRAPVVAAVKETTMIDLKRTIFENGRLAFSDLRRIFNKDTGQMLQPHEWDDDTAAAISSIKVRELFGEGKDGVGQIGTVTEVKLWDKGAALDRLMKNLGGYKEDNEQKGVLEGVGRDKLRRLVEFLNDGVGGSNRRAIAVGAGGAKG